MALTIDQKAFFEKYGYLPYTQVLSDNELEALRQRSEDIAEGRTTHVPSRYIQLEAAFRDDATPRIDTVRKMTQLCYFDDLFPSGCQETRNCGCHRGSPRSQHQVLHRPTHDETPL